ncbi:MAG: hypothetical protein OXD43_09440 [Bacteroidetes bacterium]|nr:hypothetical protein [Bacteroidota bacterium]
MPATIAALTVATLVASALREWGYYIVLGEEFIMLNSPTDYTSNTIRWLPEFVLFGAAGILLSRVTARAEEIRSDEEAVQRSLFLRVTKFLRAKERYVLPLGIVLIGGISLMRDDSPTIADWVFFAMGCWLLFSPWIVRRTMASVKLSIVGKLGLHAGPLFAALIFWNGLMDATRDLALRSGEYRIVHTTGEVENNIQLLRTTSKGILVLQVPSQEVSFLTYSSFDRIDREPLSQ